MALEKNSKSSNYVKITGYSPKSSSRSTSVSGGQRTGSVKSTSSIKTLYGSSKTSGTASRSSSSSASQNKGKTSSTGKNTSSVKTLYGTKHGYGNVTGSNNSWAQNKNVTNVAKEVNSAGKPGGNEDKVDVGQLLWGIGDQAANQFVGNAVGAIDMLIGTPYQKALDYAEEKLGLPDLGVNAISAFNNRLQENAARDAEYYAKNASKSELASLINEYGPDVIAMIPEIALAFASGGTSAVAGAGIKGFKAASKADDISDAIKLAGKWVKNNPNTVMNFLQTTGNARNQALRDGASEPEAFTYALLNGGMDAMITKYGVGTAQKGIESLPKNLRDGWKKVSNTVKSADAIVQEVAEGQIYGAMQRASRGIYDGDVKLVSLRDENAVINPRAMLESAVMDTIAPAAMGGIDRRKGSPEPTKVKVDAELGENSGYKEENKDKKGDSHNKGNKSTKGKQEESDDSLKKVLDGKVLNSKELKNLNMKDPKVQQLISEKSGIPISSSDNANEAFLRQKIQRAAMEIAKKNAQENESASKRPIEKTKGGTYNKSKRRK